MTRYYAETVCEHGRMQAHDIIGEVPGEVIPECNGGSRREVSLDVTAVLDYLIKEFSITDMVDRDTLLVHAYDMEKAALVDPPTAED